LSACPNTARADAALPALNSYGQPPFVPVRFDRSEGLAKTFVELVNKATSGQPWFDLENVPRRRLEQTLSGRDFSGVALFLAPEFLVASAQQGVVWSDPVMIDENLIVSVRPLNVSSLKELHGLRLGGIAGHIYRLLGPMVDEGKVLREDAPDHVSNLRKLCLGRVDFVVISRSELAGTTPHVPCVDAFRPTAFPEPQVIVRRVLVRMPNAESARAVLEAVAAVACGPQWSRALAHYGLSTVGCRSAVVTPAVTSPAKTKKGRAIARPANQQA
jgi:polar amino acid transport system substrate-binding protein